MLRRRLRLYRLGSLHLTISPTTGNYYLEFGATNWVDTEFDTGLAIDGVTIGGQPIVNPTGPTGPTPEPSTLVLLGSGLLADNSRALKRKLSH